jgi:hypothetical protein
MDEAVVRRADLLARRATAQQDHAYAIAQANMALGRVRMLEELLAFLDELGAAPPPQGEGGTKDAPELV